MRKRLAIVRAYAIWSFLVATDYAIIVVAAVGLVVFYANGLALRETLGQVWWWMFYTVFFLAVIGWYRRERGPLARRRALYTRRLKNELYRTRSR